MIHISKRKMQKIVKLINKNFSEREISRETGIKRTTLQNIFKQQGLRTATDNPFFLKRKLKRIKKTCMDKYGVDNPAKLPEIKLKIYNTCVERYGEDFCFGVFSSKFQQKVEEYVQSICPSAVFEVGGFRKWNRLRGRHYSPRVDILIPEKRIVIECYGDYWHANPRLFRSDDIIDLFKGSVTAAEIRKLDKSRKRQIESFGYKVYVVWENDFKHNPNNVKNQIREWCFSS